VAERQDLGQLARYDLLVLDDFAGAPMEPAERTDLLELLDDRVGTRATLITSQMAVNQWHAWLDDPTVADAILDRIVHGSRRLALKGPSLRGPEWAFVAERLSGIRSLRVDALTEYCSAGIKQIESSISRESRCPRTTLRGSSQRKCERPKSGPFRPHEAGIAAYRGCRLRRRGSHLDRLV